MIKAYFDGACEPNADGGKMGCGYVIYRHEKRVDESGFAYKRKDNIASNNIAEYVAFGKCVQCLLENHLDINEIYIFGDSKLVIEQMDLNWHINKGKYVAYAKRALLIFNKLNHIVPQTYIEWIPKERNIEADKLSRKYI